MKLPPVFRGGPGATFASCGSDLRHRSSPSKTGMPYVTAAAATTSGPWRQAMPNKSLTWGASTPREAADECYQDLIDEPRVVGPGSSENWPLHHDGMYMCKLHDMQLAWRMRDAYEVGYRGRKRDRLTQAQLTCAKNALPLTKRVVSLEETMTCDTCGIVIEQEKDAGAQAQHGMLDHVDMVLRTQPKPPKKDPLTGEEIKPLPGQMQAPGCFYYCRRCKRAGNRHEICPACHAVDVIQSEGKHQGKELHPHFSRCQHRSLIKRRMVADVVPGMPHIRRVMCDYCGHVAGSFDSDCEVYVCPECPELHGLRFEICQPCYSMLQTSSQGVDKLYSTTY